jgi:HSP20 family protein
MSTMIPWRTRFQRLAPWSDFESLQDRLDRIWGRVPGVFPEETMEWLPAVDLQEKDDEFLLTAEFPGMDEKDVAVDVEGNTLTLKGEKKTEREEKKKNGRWHLVERAWGSFERSLTLPISVDSQRIKAEFKNGLLTVHLPKRETSTARRVPISGK